MPDPHPSLEVTGGGRDSFLPALKTLTRPYHPFPLSGGIATWRPSSPPIFACAPTSGSAASVSGSRTAAPSLSTGFRLITVTRRLTLLSLFCSLEAEHHMPGLTGGSGDTYVRHMLNKARDKGWRVVVFNSRGCGNSPVTTPQFYSASFTEDLREVVAHVSSRYPNGNLYAVGFSLGANILVRYLGQESHMCPLSGAVSLCNPLNLVIADEDFHKGFNNVYDKALAKFSRSKRVGMHFFSKTWEVRAANAKSVRVFDDGLTRVSFGFKSVDDCYSNSSSSDSIKHVSTPLLCIQAANDPIAPSRGIPHDDIK
ncbi:hypothetical protein RJ639_003450, partial [Escallonia herrerae]